PGSTGRCQHQGAVPAWRRKGRDGDEPHQRPRRHDHAEHLHPATRDRDLQVSRGRTKKKRWTEPGSVHRFVLVRTTHKKDELSLTQSHVVLGKPAVNTRKCNGAKCSLHPTSTHICDS